MTFPERRLERPLDPPEARFENTQDVLPPTERSQDPERSFQGLVNDSARPLTDDERKIADRDAGSVGERVYAPASERVPKTVSSYGDVINNPDTATPERQAASATAAEPWPNATEPSFTRVPRPSNSTQMAGTTDGEVDPDSTDARWPSTRWASNLSGGSMLPIGMGWLGISVCAGIGVWLWMRWQRERNKPINRLRRQARDAAALARSRMQDFDIPEIPDEATRPAIGLGTALVSIAVLLWQRSQSSSRAAQVRGRADKMRGRADEMRGRAQKGSKQARKLGRQAADSVSDLDWQQRLMQLRDFWNANRVELEKVSIPKR